VSEEVVRDRSGKAEEAPRRVRAGEGRKTKGRARARQSPDNRTRAPTGTRGHRPARSPLCFTAGGSQGQSPKLLVRRQTHSGTRDVRRASVRRGPRAPPGRVALKSTLGSERTANAEIVDGRARASHRSDWVLVRGGRSVEVDETRLSCRFGARACASSGRTIARIGRFPVPAGPAQAGSPESARRARIRARTSGLLVTGRGRLFHATRVLCKRA